MTVNAIKYKAENKTETVTIGLFALQTSKKAKLISYSSVFGIHVEKYEYIQLAFSNYKEMLGHYVLSGFTFTKI